ncbi:SDR family NAD(P)-dependent oxidoreductase [Streptomyces sp. MZ04]|uniref:SDR family NAD(P)-dependent oxidoreductase n=1 Tax=Streptomyces sp. MZ04 TaxID=2559236 RepID=UPI00107E7E17|nr:SDR family NAD(P)-dependent oxidoreductase [Streptomyces sp. MZ04]TGB13590.1 SDR family NAD(P)-dependent oxidoreductase [Streptomyces sp. MZ04]
MSQVRDFAGRSVIVTGAGSGIGRATALAFAEQGAKVVVADLNAEGAASVAAEVESGGGTAVTVVGDLSEQTVVDSVVATALEAFGGIDVLVNNAGIMDTMSAAADVTDAEWERVLRINLTAPFLLTRAALPHMLEAGRGAIVFTASEASLRGSAAGAAYTASKHGIAGLTKSLAVTYRNKGIRANAIAPGGTITNIRVDVDPDAPGPQALGAYMGNVGQPAAAETQAAAIVFLASDAARNINGVVLPVDGGWSAV